MMNFNIRFSISPAYARTVVREEMRIGCIPVHLLRHPSPVNAGAGPPGMDPSPSPNRPSARYTMGMNNRFP